MSTMLSQTFFTLWLFNILRILRYIYFEFPFKFDLDLLNLTVNTHNILESAFSILDLENFSFGFGIFLSLIFNVFLLF